RFLGPTLLSVDVGLAEQDERLALAIPQLLEDRLRLVEPSQGVPELPLIAADQAEVGAAVGLPSAVPDLLEQGQTLVEAGKARVQAVLVGVDHAQALQRPSLPPQVSELAEQLQSGLQVGQGLLVEPLVGVGVAEPEMGPGLSAPVAQLKVQRQSLLEVGDRGVELQQLQQDVAEAPQRVRRRLAILGPSRRPERELLGVLPGGPGGPLLEEVGEGTGELPGQLLEVVLAGMLHRSDQADPLLLEPGGLVGLDQLGHLGA